MRALLLSAVVVASGCLGDPEVEVDQPVIDIARGTSQDILVTLDGEPTNAYELLWDVDDAGIVSVTHSYDGEHLRIGGNLEGDTTLHVSSHGQDIPIEVHVGPPALVTVWTEPSTITTSIGKQIQVRAKALDTLARVVDVTFDSRWDVRDDRIIELDYSGMMVRAVEPGTTSIHVAIGGNATVVPVAVFK